MKESSLEIKHLGNRLLVSDKYEEALAVFERLIGEEPLLPDGYIGKARVLERLDKYAEIVDLLGNVKDKFDSAHLRRLLGDAHRILANRGKKEHVDLAINIYEEYLQTRNDAVIMFYLAELYELRKRDFQSALKFYVESLKYDPKNREAVKGVRDCLIKLGRIDEFSSLEKEWKKTE